MKIPKAKQRAIAAALRSKDTVLADELTKVTAARQAFMHFASQADDALGDAYRKLVAFKLGMDQMDEIPKDFDSIYKMTTKAIGDVGKVRQDVYNVRMHTNRLARKYSGASTRVAAQDQLPVEYFLLFMSHKLTQWDQRETLKEMKRGGRGNIYRLGLLLQALQTVEKEVHSIKTSTDPADFEKLKKSFERHFTDFPPRRATLKGIDSYLATGKRPKIA